MIWFLVAGFVPWVVVMGFAVWVLGYYEPKFGGRLQATIFAVQIAAPVSALSSLGYGTSLFVAAGWVRRQTEAYARTAAIVLALTSVALFYSGFTFAAGWKLLAPLDPGEFLPEVMGVLLIGGMLGVVDVLVGKRFAPTDAA